MNLRLLLFGALGLSSESSRALLEATPVSASFRSIQANCAELSSNHAACRDSDRRPQVGFGMVRHGDYVKSAPWEHMMLHETICEV